MLEFGDSNKNTIVLLHGGGLSWWNYESAIPLLEEQYHLVIPLIDGHAGSDCEFVSIEHSADVLIDHIDQTYGGTVSLIAGLSLGGQIALEALSRRGDLCTAALIESALATPLSFTKALMGPSIKASYPLVKKRWFSKLQFDTLHIAGNLFESYYRDTCLISKQSMIAMLEANVGYRLKEGLINCRATALVVAGSKERPVMRRSAQMIHQAMEFSQLSILEGFRHGDLSINHPDLFAQKVRDLAG